MDIPLGNVIVLLSNDFFSTGVQMTAFSLLFLLQQEFMSAELGQILVVTQMFRFQETLFSLELGYFPSVKL